MFDDAMEPNDTGLLELTSRLESYAGARLIPTAVGQGRIRANVMNAAHRRARLIAAGVAVTADPPSEHSVTMATAGGRSAPSAWRRPAAALVAASLVLAMVAGTAYGAKAGGPLYATRLWIEAANLPVEVLARAQAEVGRLDARVREAQQASLDGDAPGVEAALAAYSVIVIEAVGGAAGDANANAAIELSLTRHVAVLTALAGTVPAPAVLAVQHALAASSKVLDDLTGQPSRGNGPLRGDGGMSGPTGPNASKPAPPGRDAGPAAVPGGEVKERPAKTATPERGSTGDDASPPPHPSREGSRGTPDPSGRRSPDPVVPSAKPSGPAKDGGP
jgi:hypothetical protein